MPCCRVRRRDILYLPLGKVAAFNEHVCRSAFFFFFFFAVASVPPEPVGTKAPALTGDLKGGWKARKSGFVVVLFCPAQGHPVPSFR